MNLTKNNGRHIELHRDCQRMLNDYLQKQQFVARLAQKAEPELSLIVVIPSFMEESNDLKSALKTLLHCEPPEGKVEVITVINCAESADKATKEFHTAQYEEMLTFAQQHDNDFLSFHFILETEMPKKFAGVGLARKIGMDEAVFRFLSIGNNEGVILCFDADSRCEKNYLSEVEKAFSNHPKAVAASIHFEHPIEGEDEPIVLYELHLRYFRQALKYAKHPHAYHTVGSSMAVRSHAYQAQNGMNRRKAGEDFYFLQKLIPFGDFLEINQTAVIPSPRTSDRVPFGTGRAMMEYYTGRNLDLSYPFKAFDDIKTFLQVVHREYKGDKLFSSAFFDLIPAQIKVFLLDQGFEDRVEDLVQYGTNELSFSKRFYNWFNVFRAMKYIHFVRDHHYGEEKLIHVSNELLRQISSHQEDIPPLELLNRYRALDKGMMIN